MEYRIVFATSAGKQIAALRANQRSRIIGGIERSLRHGPAVEARSRKRLRPNPLAPWELRIGELRVFYDIEPASEDQPGTVSILAVGVKRGDRLVIAGRSIRL